MSSPFDSLSDTAPGMRDNLPAAPSAGPTPFDTLSDAPPVTANRPAPAPQVIVNPGAGPDYDVSKEMKVLGYEGAKGASFGLSNYLGTPEMQEQAQQFESAHPKTALGAQIAGGLVPGFIAPEIIPGMGAEATLGQRVLANAGLGAGIGAISGVTEGTGSPYRNAIAGALTGASAGSLLGAAAGNIAPVIRKIVSGGNADLVGEKATGLIAQRITQDEAYGHPGAAALADALDRANTQGIPTGIMDVGGENVRSFAGGLYRMPGEPRAAISQYLTSRDEGATNRLLDAIDGAVSTGSKTADEAVQEQLAARSQAAAPLYDALYSRYPVVSSDRIDQFINEPIIQQGLQAGVKLQRLEALRDGQPFDQKGYTVDWNEAGDPVWKGTPNLQTLDAAKRGLDSILSSDTYRNQYGQLTQMGRAIDGVRRSFVGELDSLTGGPDGAYAQARAAWAGPSRSMEMIREGNQWMSKDPGQLGREVSALSPSDRDFYLLGVANDMRTKVLQHADSGDESKRILNSPLARQRAAAIFEPGVYNDLVDKVLGERQAFQTFTSVAKGSQTAGRTAEDTGNKNHPGTTSGLFVPLLITAAEHDPALAAGYGGFKGLQGLYRWANTPSPQVQTRAAQLLTEPAPAQAQTLRGIAGTAPTPPRMTQALTPGIAGIAGRLPANFFRQSTMPGEIYREPVPQQARGGIIG